MDDECTILHLDMDAFFASVEVLDDPSLAGRPVIVGRAGPRGAVASCNYEARAFGVRSAMSSVEAQRRCPAAVFVAPRMARYAEVSAALGQILRQVTPQVEPVGLDEAFLDVSGARRRLGGPSRIAVDLRQQVADQLHLSCAVGVARTKPLAKLASRQAKRVAPTRRVGYEGVVVVAPPAEAAFVDSLSLADVPGVGPATVARLRNAGLRRVGDLAGFDLAHLVRLVGTAAATPLAVLLGLVDPPPVQACRPAQSIGREVTLGTDLVHAADIAAVVAGLAADVAARLGERRLAARTVVLKLRFADRRTITRSTTAPLPMAGPHELFEPARRLLDSQDFHCGVRLVGLAGSGLVPAPAGQQLTLDLPGDGDQRWQQVEAAVQAVQQRFGPRSVLPAAGVVAEDRRAVPVADVVRGTTLRED